MDKYTSVNQYAAELTQYETPFADVPEVREAPQTTEPVSAERFSFPEFESPFALSYESSAAGMDTSPLAAEYVQMAAELHDAEFTNALYELASEMEDSWSSKISSETAMGDRYIPFATQQAQEYLMPLVQTLETTMDQLGERLSPARFTDNENVDIEQLLAELEGGRYALSPAQDQFVGAFFKKVKTAVNKGVELAKKGISAVGRILPINLILNKLKGLIRPLLDRVLRFAIGKLPKSLQPHARTLAKRLLNLEAPAGAPVFGEGEIPTTAELDAFQYELDAQISQLVLAPNEDEAGDLVMQYEAAADTLERESRYQDSSGLNLPSLEAAHRQLVEDLKQLPPGGSAAPAIERFLPAAILALQPVVKMGIGIIGRQRIIDFLANLLAQLVSKYIPAEVARPLASKIVDIGMSAIGFETYEGTRPDVAYEAIANTLTDTVRHMGALDEAVLDDQEALAAVALEAFETAVADNFPSQYVRENLRKSTSGGVWVLKPRGGTHRYKKYSQVFTVTIDPQTARSVRTFRGVPLAHFLKDKLGMDPSKPVQARVHLFEAIDGSWLSHISRHEKLPGLSSVRRQGWVQFHPLTTKAAALLLKEPGLGRDFSAPFTRSRHRIAVGQRFYFLEINGARVRVHVPQKGTKAAPGPSAPKNAGTPVAARSSDIQAVINFIRSEIRINYFFSEEEAREVVEKLNRNDYLGAGLKMRSSVRTTLHGILLNNVGSKVKIIHEAVPELYLENYAEEEGLWDTIKSGAKAAVSGVGKGVLLKIVEKLTEKLAALAYTALVNYFKARAAEFRQAQAQPQDGVTVKISWINVPGMSAIRAVITAIRGNMSLGNLADLTLPNIPTPDVQIRAGKNFD